MNEDIRRDVSHELARMAREVTDTTRALAAPSIVAATIAGRNVAVRAVQSGAAMHGDNFGLRIHWERDGEPIKRAELLHELTEALANTF